MDIHPYIHDYSRDDDESKSPSNRKTTALDIFNRVKESFIYEWFDRVTMKRFEHVIKEQITSAYPMVYKLVRVEGHEIHIDELFFNTNSGVVYFIPYLFNIQKKFFYDLYAGYRVVCQIAFDYSIDPRNPGYTYEVSSRMPETDFETCPLDLYPKKAPMLCGFDQLEEKL